MSVLLAALDDSAAAQPVVTVARRLATILHSEVVAVHVTVDGSGATAALAARQASVPLRTCDGDVVAAIAAIARDLHAGALVIGTRALPHGTTPAGHVSLELAQELAIPVFMVPPDAEDRPLERVLVALEGDGERESLLAVARQLHPGGPDVVAVHVFPPLDLPAFSDHPVHETEAWAREFIRRAHSTPYAQLELQLRVGDPAVEVSKAVRELDVDMVALLWHRDTSFGHARLVRRVLETSRVPVLLLPTARAVATERHRRIEQGT